MSPLTLFINAILGGSYWAAILFWWYSIGTFLYRNPTSELFYPFIICMSIGLVFGIWRGCVAIAKAK